MAASRSKIGADGGHAMIAWLIGIITFVLILFLSWY